MRVVVLAILAVSIVSCVKTETRLCGDFVCAQNDVCTPDGTKCASPLAITACQAKSDGDACSYPGTPSGVCSAQVCELSGCGNGVIEPLSDEVCDDGNRLSGDGCSADCRSAESCGDGVADSSAGEHCDCGSDPANLPLGCKGVNSQDSNATCRLNCTLGGCGDGVVDDQTERCDDGNNISGDGCAADCSGRWVAMQSNTFATLHAAWAPSPSDAWAVGDNRIMRWNGTTWYRQPEIDSTTHNYSAVCGFSSSDVLFFDGNGGRILHYQGTGTTGTWSYVTPLTAGYQWTNLFCRGNMAWLAGAYTTGNTPAYATWNGSGFTPHDVSSIANDVFDQIWVSTDGVVFGRVSGGSGGLYRQDPANVNTWVLQSPFTILIAGTTSADVTVMTSSGAEHLSSTWSAIPNSDEPLSVTAMAAVPGSTTSQFLVVGESGRVLDCDIAGCKISPVPVQNLFFGVFALDATHAFIVGQNGTILY